MPLFYEIADLSLRLLHRSSPGGAGARASVAPAIETLERFLDEFPDPSLFLANPAATGRYYELLRAYFQKAQFPRRSYEHVLAQLRVLSTKFPELANNLWRRPAACTTTLQLLQSTSGRRLNQPLWRVFRSRWLYDLRRKTNGLDRAAAAALVGNLRERITAFRAEAAALRKRDRLRAQGQFFSGLKQDAELTRLAAYLVLEQLVAARHNLLLSITDADLALDFFQELRDEVSTMLGLECDENYPDFLAWKLKSLIPDRSKLLRDRDLFPVILNPATGIPHGIAVANAETKYVTAEVRGLHAIFTGIPFHDCLAGNEGNLDQCTPRRWAIGALAGARSFVFERNGRFQGVIRLVRVRAPSGRTFYSAGFCVPIFNSRTRDAGSTQTLFESWYPGFAGAIEAVNIPVLVSESRLADLSQVKPTICQTDAYLLGTNVGLARDFQVDDPRGNDYLQGIPPGPAALNYGASFITDALFNDAGDLRALSWTGRGSLGHS